MMPRFYREAPLNSIWEGSGNIMCLDVLRAMNREEAAIPAILQELEAAQGAHPALDAAAERLKSELDDPADIEVRARGVTELMAVSLQASILAQHAPSAVADAFCSSRLGSHWHGAFGALAAGTDFDAIIGRASPGG